MEHNIIANHRRYVERIRFYKNAGYDVEEERSFILEKACPVGGKILEVGTGKGYFTLALALQGYHFTSVDVSEEEQVIAQQTISYYNCNRYVNFRIENAENLSFKNGSFDNIFSINMIHHLAKPFAVLDELIRVLSPKGKMILSDFTDDGFDIIQTIHQCEGRTHEGSSNDFKRIKEYLRHNHFIVHEFRSTYQDIVVVSRSIT